MGAWGYDIFDDDTAYDFVTEIKEDARSFFMTSFQNARKDDVLAFDDCHKVTVSAAYIDNLLNGTQYRTDCEAERDESNVNYFRQMKVNPLVEDLVAMAIVALEKVVSERSELHRTWQQNEELYPQWKQSITDLIERLQSRNQQQP